MTRAVRRRSLLDAVDAAGEVLRHLAAVDRVDARLLEGAAVAAEVGVAVELRAMLQSSRPREDACDRVRARRVALLVLAVVTRHRAVRRLRLDRPAVGTHEDGRHQAERAVACEEDGGHVRTEDT